MRFPSSRPLPFTLDDAGTPAAPSLRHPVVAVPPVRRDPRLSPPPQLAREPRAPTLPPPLSHASKGGVIQPSGVAMIKLANGTRWIDGVLARVAKMAVRRP